MVFKHPPYDANGSFFSVRSSSVWLSCAENNAESRLWDTLAPLIASWFLEVLTSSGSECPSSQAYSWQQVLIKKQNFPVPPANIVSLHNTVPHSPAVHLCRSCVRIVSHVMHLRLVQSWVGLAAGLTDHPPFGQCGGTKPHWPSRNREKAAFIPKLQAVNSESRDLWREGVAALPPPSFLLLVSSDMRAKTICPQWTGTSCWSRE